MLNFGLWSSSKGMGRIPDLEGLSINDARVAITNAGFNLGNETPLGNSSGATSSNNNKVKGRIDTNSLLNYESVLDFEYYVYSVTPVAPTPIPTPTPTPTPVPTPTVPQLATPSLSVTTGAIGSGAQSYANITIGNFDYFNSYSSSMGSQNTEYSQEWNINGLTPGQSYTVYVTASRVGYISAQGSITFTAYVNATPTPVPTPIAVCPKPGMPSSYDSVCGDTCCDSDGRPYVAPTPTPIPTPVASYCVDDDATSCIGYNLYQNRYDATYQGASCPPRLIETNSATCGYVAPAPAPAPAPTPAPTAPQNCTPVYSYNEYRSSCGQSVAIYVNPCTGAESYTCPSPTPVPTPAPTPAPTPTPVAQNCSGYYYAYGEGRCGGYASIYNGCGVFLGCND